jgi:hypothetical protein
MGESDKSQIQTLIEILGMTNPNILAGTFS